MIDHPLTPDLPADPSVPATVVHAGRLYVLTHHACIRMNQRQVSVDDLHIVFARGVATLRLDGCMEHRIPERPDCSPDLVGVAGLTVIVAADRLRVVTVTRESDINSGFHRGTPAFRRRVKRLERQRERENGDQIQRDITK